MNKKSKPFDYEDNLYQQLKERVDALPNRKSQIRHLKEVIINYEAEHAGSDSFLIDELIPNSFYSRCKRELTRLERLQQLELESKTNEETLGDPAEIEDDSGGQEWNNSTKALALYALLRYAGLPKGFKITAVAKLASLITGRSQRKIANAIRNADGGSFSDEDGEAVAELFDEMGLQEIAAEVRRKFYKIGTGYRTGSKSRS